MTATDGDSNSSPLPLDVESAAALPHIRDSSTTAFLRKLGHLTVAEWRIIRYVESEQNGWAEFQCLVDDVRAGNQGIVQGRCRTLQTAGFACYTEDTPGGLVLYPWTRSLLTDGVEDAIEAWND